MERVAFLIEETGERLGCLMNPESLSVSRVAGVRPRRSVGGPLTGARLSDDPLLFTGGGVTELTLDLLFDTSVAGSTIRSDDIRDLTLPLRELAENNVSSGGRQLKNRPPVARFIWGKAWNIRGVVTAIAERLESFTATGVPRRSWLRLRFVRVEEPFPNERSAVADQPSRGDLLSSSIGILNSAQAAGPSATEVPHIHEVVGNTNPNTGSSERLDEIAHRHYGSASYWRLIASANGIRNPFRVSEGTRLIIPSLAQLKRSL